MVEPKLTISQQVAQMRILDYLTFANDPSREAIYSINKLARNAHIVDWLREEEPNYYINDKEMATYLEE